MTLSSSFDTCPFDAVAQELAAAPERDTCEPCKGTGERLLHGMISTGTDCPKCLGAGR